MLRRRGIGLLTYIKTTQIGVGARIPNRGQSPIVLRGPKPSAARRLVKTSQWTAYASRMFILAQPIVALVAGILILVMPRLLNYIVALYLIIVGILGLLT